MEKRLIITEESATYSDGRRNKLIRALEGHRATGRSVDQAERGAAAILNLANIKRECHPELRLW
jgi:hypothetical protein